MLLSVVSLLALLAVCSFAPGFAVVRKFRWNPLEKFCAAIGVSLILLYIAATVLHWLQPSDWRVPCLAVSALSVAAAVAAHRDIRRLAGSPVVRRVLLGFLFLLAWMLAIQSIIRVYSGGGWAGDWLEHFQRSLFFLRNFPPQTPVFENYILPARPPMMNLLAAFFLAQVGDRFELYQLAFLFLNLLVFLPCCLLAPLLAPRGRWRILPVVALVGLCPMVIENVTYTATKLLIAFYVMLALRFYLTGWRKQDTLRMTAAFVFLAAAMLVHYSAGPYLVFLAGHYLLVLWRRRREKWRELAAVTLAGGALLATWFGWSLPLYGAAGTFGSNTTVTGTRAAEGSNLAKVSANIFDTVVPHPLRGDASVDALFPQSSALGQFRDYVFLINQTTAIFALGIFGGPLALYLLYRACRRDPGPKQRPVRIFWLGYVLFGLIVGVAVHGERDLFGVAHVTLQPLVVLGLTWLAAGFPSLPRAAAYLIVAGCLLDFAAGMAPHLWLQDFENSPERTIFLDPMSSQGRPGVFSRWTWTNWFAKHQYALTTQWIGQLRQSNAPGADDIRAQLRKFQDEDTVYWRGWYAQHGGSVTYMGDRVAGSAGSAVPMALTAAMFLLLMAALAWESLRPPLAVSAAVAPASRKQSGRQKPGRTTRAARS
jgi:hypothetical protein